MAEKEEAKDEVKEVKPKQKTLIDYAESGGKGQLSIVSIDKKGDIIRINKSDREEDSKDGDALKELKKFVGAL